MGYRIRRKRTRRRRIIISVLGLRPHQSQEWKAATVVAMVILGQVKSKKRTERIIFLQFRDLGLSSLSGIFFSLLSSYFTYYNHHGLLTTPETQSAISTLRASVPKFTLSGDYSSSHCTGTPPHFIQLCIHISPYQLWFSRSIISFKTSFILFYLFF